MKNSHVLAPSKSVRLTAITKELCYNIDIETVTYSGVRIRSSLCNPTNPTKHSESNLEKPSKAVFNISDINLPVIF